MIKLLKHKDIDVALIELSNMGIVLSVKDIFNKEHLPLSCIRKNGVLDDGRFGKWWSERGISENRKEYGMVMRELGSLDRDRLLLISDGLSLSDHYWMDTVTARRKWKDINFYENKFDNSLGRLFFGIKKQNKKYNLNSPDVTSSGNLRKRWEIRDDGKRILIKSGNRPYMQEPVNEVIAANICKKLKIPHVSYYIDFRKDEPRSNCINMTDINNELVHAIDVYNIFEPSYTENNILKHFIKCTTALNVKNCHETLDKMMVLDYIMLNHDRHFANFGVLRNSEKLNNYRMAPNYDTGSSLFFEDSVAMIRLPEYAKSRKICFDTLEKQLKLVRDWNWLDISALKDIGKDSKDLLMEIPSVEKKRAESLSQIIEKRVAEIGIIAQRKQEKIGKSGR
ncbi:MAG: HipA domain-containing protein [Treponema sp.]|nr:HipA domain-containing protein [Treponema sp.]